METYLDDNNGTLDADRHASDPNEIDEEVQDGCLNRQESITIKKEKKEPSGGKSPVKKCDRGAAREHDRSKTASQDPPGKIGRRSTGQGRTSRGASSSSVRTQRQNDFLVLPVFRHRDKPDVRRLASSDAAKTIFSSRLTISLSPRKTSEDNTKIQPTYRPVEEEAMAGPGLARSVPVRQLVEIPIAQRRGNDEELSEQLNMCEKGHQNTEKILPGRCVRREETGKKGIG